MHDTSRAATADRAIDRGRHRPDDGLPSRFARHDPGAVDEIYANHGTSLFRTAYRMLGDHDLASEAVQRAMLRAWQRAHAFDHRRPLEPWLHAICRRSAIDTYRSHRRHPHPVDGDELSRKLPSVDLGTDAMSTATDVRRAIDALPGGEQDVVRLAYLDGLTYSEVAAALGIPVGTVKSRASRAHRRLAARLGHLRWSDH